MKRILVLVFLLSFLFVVAASADNSLERTTDTKKVKTTQPAGENQGDLIDLLWWLRRAGSGADSFTELANDVWNSWQGSMGITHNGPSR